MWPTRGDGSSPRPRAAATAAATASKRAAVRLKTRFASASLLKKAAANLTHSARPSIDWSEDASNVTSTAEPVDPVPNRSMRLSCEPLLATCSDQLSPEVVAWSHEAVTPQPTSFCTHGEVTHVGSTMAA